MMSARSGIGRNDRRRATLCRLSRIPSERELSLCEHMFATTNHPALDRTEGRISAVEIPSPRGGDMSHDMSRALSEIEARIAEIERETAAVFQYLTRHPGSRAGDIAA